MTFETKIAPQSDGTAEIETTDPDVVTQLDEIANARLVHADASRKRFSLPARDAHIHFPHLFGRDAA